MCFFLKIKSENHLATHQMKLETYKCVATPWLRTTDLDSYFELKEIIIFIFNALVDIKSSLISWHKLETNFIQRTE